MLPAFLKPFEAEIKKYETSAIRVHARPLDTSILEDPLDLKTSKFLGKPFFPLSKEYPLDKSGNPMVLAAQINFSEIPSFEHFPSSGILQLFLSTLDWYEEDTKIIFHNEEDLKEDHVNNFDFLTEENYDGIPFFKIHELSFTEMIDVGSHEDEKFDLSFNGETFWDYYDQLDKAKANELLSYFQGGGHKMGGYSFFMQSDPRDKTHNEIQLLQIDVDEEIEIGDGGLIHIFINKEDLLKQNFEKAYFHWDCG